MLNLYSIGGSFFQAKLLQPFLQQFLRRFDVVVLEEITLLFAKVVLDTRRPRRNKAERRNLTPLQHVFHKQLAVDGQREGLADFRVAQDFILRVEHEVVGPKVGRHLRLAFIDQLFRQIGRRSRHVELTGFKHLVFRVLVVDHGHIDLFQFHFVGGPVIRVLLQDNLGVVHPLGEHERSVAHVGRRFFMPVGVLFVHVLRNREQRVERRQAEEVRRRLFQRHLQRVIVERLHADVIGFRFALVILLAVLQVVQLIRVVRGGIRVEKLLPRIFKIVGRHRLPVAPLCVFAQVERVREAIVRNLPFLGDPRLHFAVFSEACQAFHDVDEHLARRRVRRFGRKQRRRLRMNV